MTVSVTEITGPADWLTKTINYEIIKGNAIWRFGLVLLVVPAAMTTGFRSTRIRTTEGHLVTIPNSVIANSSVENIGKRPFIRRTSNITITYDSGHTKAKRAVEIIKEVLAGVPEVNSDPEKPPRVYFSDFNDWSLNIYMSYWVKPPDYWLYHKVNEQVNLDIMKRFESEQIEFAFPSQALYLKKD